MRESTKSRGGLNSFCLYCTGNKRKVVRACEDKYCPFYKYKYVNLNDKVLVDENKEIKEKLKGAI